MLLEICASSLQSARNAQLAGAHRIELCSELGVGGLTPSYGLLRRVMKEIKIPVYVLIRPRSGDFTYTDAELSIMEEDIKICRELKCAGVVCGVLRTDQAVDIEVTERLLRLAKPLDFTFHRAFDWAVEPMIAMEGLVNIGVKRILSSGQAKNAPSGIELLNKLRKAAAGRIEIQPGGGINAENISRFKEMEFVSVHSSATTIFPGSGVGSIPMNTPRMLEEGIRIVSDVEKIRGLVEAIKL